MNKANDRNTFPSGAPTYPAESAAGRAERVKKKAKKERSAKRKEIIFQVICVLILSVIAFCQLFPFWLKLVDSLQSPDLIPDSDKLYVWPVNGTFQNYLTALRVSGFWRALGNTLFHSVMFTAISLFLAIIVGYTLAKMRFKGKKLVSNLLLCTMMVPGEVLMIPNYILVMNMGLNYSIWGLILPGIVNVFGIFLIRQYMMSIPFDLDEAAYIDGASRLEQLWYITLPSILPTIAIMLIMNCGRVMNIGFEKVFLMQTDLNLGVSEVISTFVYSQGIRGAQTSYATAVGLMNSVVNFILVIVVNAISRHVSEVSLW